MYRRQPSTLELWDQHIRSFVALCSESESTTDPCCNVDDNVSERTRMLAGITVGVKDIIDVEGLPTRNGSDVYRDADNATEDAAQEDKVIAQVLRLLLASGPAT